MGFFDKRLLKKYMKEADKVIAYESQMAALSNEELQAKTPYFRELLNQGKTLDDIKYEAFAVAREAAKRCIGEFPYKVQIIGSLVLHAGDVAEMKTGEGKTLTCTMAVYLNALSGKGLHVITVNEYLSGRDAEWMGQIYRFLGLTVGVNARTKSTREKKEAYLCDITYTTNSELGFDYLRDNMVVRKEDRVQRGLNYIILDEVDSILIDEARTPLIISGGRLASANLYKDADHFVKSLKNEVEYNYDEELLTKQPLSYSFKGISGIGENKTSAVQTKYKLVNPSHLGRLDMTDSSNSDPGMSGTLVPYAKLYEGGYLSDFHEPCKGRDDLDKLYEEYKQLNGIVELEFAKSAMLGRTNSDTIMELTSYKELMDKISNAALNLNDPVVDVVSELPLVEDGSITIGAIAA